MRHTSGLVAYRIGGGPKPGKHWAHRWHVDFWFRSWQCEWNEALWCPRAWTKKGALRKGRRWFRNGTDIRRHEAVYGPKPWLYEQRGAVLAAGSPDTKGAQ